MTEEVKESVEWQAFEYHHHEKSSDWYWALGIIAIALCVTAILLGNILFAIVIVLSAFTLALYANRKPRRITVRLTSTSIHLGEESYSYGEIDSFWMEDRDHSPRIIFKSIKSTSPFIIFPVEGVSSDHVREFLGKYIPEVEHEEPFSQKIMEYLGF